MRPCCRYTNSNSNSAYKYEVDVCLIGIVLAKLTVPLAYELYTGQSRKLIDRFLFSWTLSILSFAPTNHCNLKFVGSCSLLGFGSTVSTTQRPKD